MLIAVAVLSLTSLLGYRFYNAPRLDIGKAAPQTIVSPASLTIEDTKATEERRKAARKGASSVLMLNQLVNDQIHQSLQQQFTQASDVRQLAAPFPFVKPAMLSLPVQSYLRRSPNDKWQPILSSTIAPERAANLLLDADQQAAIAELQASRLAADSQDSVALLQALTQARSRYSLALSSLLPSAEDAPAYDATLLEVLDNDWPPLQAKITQIAEEVLLQGIPPGLPPELLQAAVRLRVKNTVPEPGRTIAAQILLRSLQPNLIRDEEQTRFKAEQAALEIKPELVTVRQGQVIVRVGETITSAEFALLDRFGLSRRSTDWVSLLGFGTLVSSAIGFYGYLERRHPRLRQRDRLLLLLLVMTTPLLIILRVPATNLPAIGLLVSTFYGSPLGVAVTGLLALLLAIGLPIEASALVASAAAGLLSGFMASHLRSREDLALLGVGVGLLQGSLYLLLNIATGIAWYTLLGAAAIQALLGLAWCIVAIGGSVYLEQLFDLVTTMRLVELANPNRSLLKRLAAEAPGTFQHTLFVATLAEAAARSLNCNVELVRTGTLYHDIGKLHDPLGFIENQMGGPNKHDGINDPWKSAAVIKKHVTQGLVLARKSRLPRAVQAFIPEHQGTLLIAYFYHQAHQLPHPNRLVTEADFRYDGPIPQSRETGIVMLADACEAALRSLRPSAGQAKEATPEEALATINKILRARWQDQQLADSGLTRDNLTQIATVFVDVWQQFNHQRIAYPKLIQPPALNK